MLEALPAVRAAQEEAFGRPTWLAHAGFAHHQEERPAAVRERDLPLQGWWDILNRVRLALARDHISVAAAGVAYCSLFAAIPG